MYANYHTHTPRCRHAEGSERAYAEQALAAGLRVLGFSDHTPYDFPGGYRSTFRMGMQELDGYVRSVRALQAEYAPRLEIHLGLEVEYYPDLFPALRAVLRRQGIEYILLGQHALGNEVDGVYSGTPTRDEAVLARYVDQTVAGLRTGAFTYLAHPDLIHFIGADDVYATHMRRLCQAAKALDVPLEVNLLGLAEGRNYPDPRFWRLAGEVGNTAVLGCDAHRPQQLAVPALAERALALAQGCGLRVLQTVPLRPL